MLYSVDIKLTRTIQIIKPNLYFSFFSRKLKKNTNKIYTLKIRTTKDFQPLDFILVFCAIKDVQHFRKCY